MIMSIAENIKYLRKQNNLTQKQLAEKSGLAIITIQQYEAGKFEPKNDSLHKLRKALNCNINEILDKPYDLDEGIVIKVENLDELPQKYKELTGKSLNSRNIKTNDCFECFLCYLESLGYKLSIYNIDEMNLLHITPESEDDFYIGIQDITHDNITFFHKSDFCKFQKEVEKTIDYEIYKQFHKG